MQFIKKQDIPPPEWDDWFSTPNGRSYDYKKDSSSMRDLPLAKRYLLNEQSGLCAYCQSKLNEDDASIEHIIPKSLNKELSTSYYNLVAVCKNPIPDAQTKKSHCDKERGSKPLSPLILYENAQVKKNNSEIFNHAYFRASGSDGYILVKATLESNIQKQAESFIEILNLNDERLMNKRKEALEGIISILKSIPVKERGHFWKVQFDRVMKNPKQPFRQYLLINIAPRIGKN